jgi:hypothetical protein
MHAGKQMPQLAFTVPHCQSFANDKPMKYLKIKTLAGTFNAGINFGKGEPTVWAGSLEELEAAVFRVRQKWLVFGWIGREVHIEVKPQETLLDVLEFCAEDLENPTLCFDTPEEEEIARSAVPVLLEILKNSQGK